MNLPNGLRRSFTEATEQVLEKSRQLGKEAQLQVQLKTLQVEQAKRMHELGASTYEWHRSETLGTGAAAPAEVTDLCSQLDEMRQQIMAIELKIEDVRLQSEFASEPAAEADTP